MTPQAFLFDLDGVLVDTAEHHYLAWKELADGLGLAFDRDLNERLKGVSRMASLEIILAANGAAARYSPAEKKALAAQKNARYQALIRTITPGDVLPGIPAFLADARARGLRLAVASASRNAAAVLASLGIADLFDYVADAERIQNPKPAPDVFLDCARHLGVPPAACVGFEDAQAGVEAIKAAGMVAVGIHVSVTTVPPDVNYASTAQLDVAAVLGL